MTILSRHLYREFFLMAAACILGFLVLFLMIDFVESADAFLNNRAAAGEILRYYMLKIPGIFFMISPVAVLVAVLITVSLLARNNEFTAMFSVGIGPLRAFAPLIAGCALISVLSLGTSEILAPKANRMAREIARLRVRPGRVAAQFSLNRYWIRGENAILSAQVIDTAGRALHGFQYLEIDRNFRLVRRIDARIAEVTERGKWRLRDGRERRTTGDLQAVPQADLVIVGLSRTGKTPLSIFLAYRGWKVANVPIINMQCDVDHPTQTLADLLVEREGTVTPPEIPRNTADEGDRRIA